MVQSDHNDDVKIIDSNMIVGQDTELDQKNKTFVAKKTYADALKKDISF